MDRWTAVIKSAGWAANGLITGTAWAGWNGTPANKAFVRAFKRRYKRNPEQFAATIKSDMAKWDKLIKDAGIRTN